MGDLMYLGWCSRCHEHVVCTSPDSEAEVCDYCGDSSVYGPAIERDCPEINPNELLGEDYDEL